MKNHSISMFWGTGSVVRTSSSLAGILSSSSSWSPLLLPLLLLLDSGDLRLDPCLLLTIQHRLSLLENMSGHYRYNMNLKQGKDGSKLYSTVLDF